MYTMGNVEGQEMNLEGLTPEQRQHLQQQHELKLQQQQLEREQQQLKHRLQQHQQQQQIPKLDASKQDAGKEENKSSYQQVIKKSQQQFAQLEKQQQLPRQYQQQHQPGATMESISKVQKEQQSLEGQMRQQQIQSTSSQQTFQRQPHRTPSLQLQQHPQKTQQPLVRNSQVTKQSEQYSHSRMRQHLEESRHESIHADKRVSSTDSDPGHVSSDARPRLDVVRTVHLLKSEPHSHKERKDDRVLLQQHNSTDGLNSQRVLDRTTRQERGRDQTRIQPTTKDDAQTVNNIGTSNQSVSQQRSRPDTEKEQGGDTIQNNGRLHSSNPIKPSEPTSSERVHHPHKLPLDSKAQAHTKPRGSPNGDGSQLTSSSHTSPARSPQRSPMRSPMMAPAVDPFGDPTKELEADLSQLTEEERAHILAVLDRAKQLQEKDENRIKDMEQNLEKIEREISDRGYQSDSQVNETGSCPICYKSFRDDAQVANKDCDDCGKTVCPDCGSSMKLGVEQRERWLCDLCHRRRRFLATSGLWHKYYTQIQPQSRKSRRSSLDEAFFAIRPSPKSKRLVRTSSYSAVDDMRRDMDSSDHRPTEQVQGRASDVASRSTPNRENNMDVDSDELREEELLLLQRRSRDRSPEYERRTSAGQEEVLRHLRREERGFLVSENTIDMDPIDADHVEDLSEGPDEEEMLRQLMEMADGNEDDYASFPDHLPSSGLQSDFFMTDMDEMYGEHQEILETTQQIAKFTESRNLSDYDLHKAATGEDETSSYDSSRSGHSEQSREQTHRTDYAEKPDRFQGKNEYKPPKPVRGIVDRVSSSLESSPAHDREDIGAVENETEISHREEPHLKYLADVTSHSDSELEQKKDKTSRRKRKKAASSGGLGDTEHDTIGTDKFLSVEDLREVGIDDEEPSAGKDFLTVPSSCESETQSSFETKGNRPPAAGRGSGSGRRKKGQKYMESPLSPIRDDEVDSRKDNKTNREQEDVDTSDHNKFTYPPDNLYWERDEAESELNEDLDEDEEGYDNEFDDGNSSYLTSPGGLETVMEEQEEPTSDETWTSKRNYAYAKNQNKRIVTLNKDMLPEEIEDSSPEESKSVLNLQDAPSGKRRSNPSDKESATNDDDRLLPKRESPDYTSPERRIVRGHHRRSPEMRQDDRKDTHSKDHPPLSRVSDSISPTASPVSSRFRFSPPITPKVYSTGKSFPEATFPKDLTPTESSHHEIVDENRNAIVDRQETTPTNEIVGFAARGHQSPVLSMEKPRHSRKRHAVSTQTERRKTQREMSTQTKSEYEIKRNSDAKSMKSTGVQAGDDMEMFLPKKVLVDVGVETESDVSTTSSPVSLASSRSVGIDSRDPNYSSGMSSPVSDVGSERLYTETAVQTVNDSFVQTEPINYDRADFVAPSSYFAMDRSTHTSPSLSYQATQDPKVAQALRAVLGDYPPPPSPRSYGMHGQSGLIAKSDGKPTFSHRGNGFSNVNQERSRSHGMQTSPLNFQDAPLVSPSGSIGLSRPTSVAAGSDYARKKSAPSHPYRDSKYDAISNHHDTRISHSDTESVDSDIGTPKIRRRLPHVPADTSPSASPALGKPPGEEIGDLQAEMELDKVKGLLSRKAIQLEMERRKHELDEMTSKIFGQSPTAVSKSSPNVSKDHSHTQRNHSDGTHSDSDILSQRKSHEKRETDSIKDQHSNKKYSDGQIVARKDEQVGSPMALDKDKYVKFSKSEEDIIREIERQVTQATGKTYSALEDANGSARESNTKPSKVSDYDNGRIRESKQYEGQAQQGVKHGAPTLYDQYESEIKSQRFWDIDTSPVHLPEEQAYSRRDPRHKPSDSYNALPPNRGSGATAMASRRKSGEGSEWKKDASGKTIPQLIKDNQNEVDRLSREGEEIERRIKELTALEEKLETDYQQYRTRVSADNQMRGHPETLADYLMKAHDPSLRFEKTTDGQYEYTTAHWSNSDDSLSGSGSKLASSSSESRLLPARPSGDGSDEVEGAGLILPLEEGSDYDVDLQAPPPVPQRTDLPPKSASSSLASLQKRDPPPVTAHSETRHKQPRQLPIPKVDPQHVSRSEGHRSHPGSSQQPPVPRRSRGERTSNIFHLKRNSNGPSPGSGSGGDLGLRVVGGKRMPGSNQLVAYITDVVEGGAAQKAGLREGDQVLEWCGTPLTGKTFEEVQLIMRTARKMTDVTVKCGPNLLDSPRYRVTRPSGRDGQRSHHHSSNVSRSSSSHGHRREPPSSGHRAEHPPRQVARPTSGENKPSRITGELQVRLAYDAGRGELRVDVLRGRGLVGKSNDGLADPFVVVRLLPMKSSSDEKRTACVPRTLTPEWNQTLLFRDLRASELLTNHSLELTIWSSSRNAENFMGKVIFNLSDTKHLDNRVHWYRLTNGGSTQGKSNKNIGFV